MTNDQSVPLEVRQCAF